MPILVLLFVALPVYFSLFQMLFVHSSTLKYSLQPKQHIQNKKTLANLHSHSVLQELSSFANRFYVQHFLVTIF